MSIPVVKTWIAASSVLLGIGLCGPSMTVVPEFGGYSSFVRVLNPSLVESRTYSLCEGIVELFRSGEFTDIAVGLILLLFSVSFPLWKLSIMWASTIEVEEGRCPLRGLSFIEKYGKLSMLDIYVVAILVIAVKGLPGGSAVQIRWALLAFAASVLCSIRLPFLIRKSARTENN